MKLDMDLAREIMLAIEDDPGADGTRNCKIEIEGRTEHEIAYHIKQLSLGGLVQALDGTTTGGLRWFARDLTPTGHEFLAEARDKGLWEKAKATIKEHAVPATFKAMATVLGKLAADELARAIGSPGS